MNIHLFWTIIFRFEALLCYRTVDGPLHHTALPARVSQGLRVLRFCRAGNSGAFNAIDSVGGVHVLASFEVSLISNLDDLDWIFWARFRSDSEHLQGVERLSILKPDVTMLESDYTECDRLPGSHLGCNGCLTVGNELYWSNTIESKTLSHLLTRPLVSTLLRRLRERVAQGHSLASLFAGAAGTSGRHEGCVGELQGPFGLSFHNVESLNLLWVPKKLAKHDVWYYVWYTLLNGLQIEPYSIEINDNFLTISVQVSVCAIYCVVANYPSIKEAVWANRGITMTSTSTRKSPNAFNLLRQVEVLQRAGHGNAHQQTVATRFCV